MGNSAPITLSKSDAKDGDEAALGAHVLRIEKQYWVAGLAALTELASQNMQGRLIEPREVGNTGAWLCHPNSAAITGQAIAVTGGEAM
jgi:NAD(P)-dependent dehydrogenase (short-subunit alcohol dehydrogenase family)